MTSCLDGICGTGSDLLGPLPGDPNNIANLTATAGYGSINLVWPMPTLNPQSVAYIRIYRATNNDVNNAVLIRTVKGDFFTDYVTAGIAYYYWIDCVSINGTVSTKVGPASATALQNAVKTLQELTGLIDNSVLAQALQTKIGEITLLGTNITQEIANRMNADNALATTITGLQGQVNTAITVIETEVQQRINADSATVNQMNLWAAGFNNSIAGVADQVNILASDTTAMSSRITTTEASLYGNVATAEVGLVTKVTDHGNTIDAMYTAKVQVNGLIGGFGIHNNGTQVDAGFDVDRFWIGRTGPDKVKPFVIDGGIVYMDQAIIKDLSVQTIKIANNAITIPAYFYGSGGSGHSAGSAAIKVGEVTLEYVSAVSIIAILNWQALCGSANTNTTVEIRTKMSNGSYTGSVLSLANSCIANFTNSFCTSGKVSLPAGTYTFELWVGNNWGAGYYSLGAWGCSLFGAMK